MDARLLQEMLVSIRNRRKHIHSLVVIHNGHLALEAYAEPYHADTRHKIYSCTKSVTSALVGIALEENLFSSVREKVLDILPEDRPAEISNELEQLSLRHVLAMLAGFKWQEASVSVMSKKHSVVEMIQHDNWIRYLFRQPMEATPGTKFNYNSGASHLLTTALEKRCGRSAAEYAREKLFEPIGIGGIAWDSDPNNVTIGGWGIQMTPRDLARFGLLYLNKGNWRGEQVIASDWIEQSVQPHANILGESVLRNTVSRLIGLLRRRLISPSLMRYGYHWWVQTSGTYAARGRGGQALFVVPGSNLIAVLTGSLAQDDRFIPEEMMRKFIIPAAATSGSEPPVTLRADLTIPIAPGLPRVQPMPLVASTVTGKTFLLEPNHSGIRRLVWAFADEQVARLRIKLGDESHDLLVGMDDTFRLNPAENGEVIALRGLWVDQITFLMEWLQVTAGDRSIMAFRFRQDRLTINVKAIIEGGEERIVGIAV